MSKNELIQISRFLNISPGAEGYTSIYTVDNGKIIELKKIQIIFPAGTDGELQISLWYGDLKVAPDTDYWHGDSGKIEDCLKVKYSSGDDVMIWYKNINTTDYRKATIKIDAVILT